MLGRNHLLKLSKNYLLRLSQYCNRELRTYIEKRYALCCVRQFVTSITFLLRLVKLSVDSLRRVFIAGRNFDNLWKEIGAVPISSVKASLGANMMFTVRRVGSDARWNDFRMHHFRISKTSGDFRGWWCALSYRLRPVKRVIGTRLSERTWIKACGIHVITRTLKLSFSNRI